MEGLMWWHWLCIGMGLMLLELVVPTFTILWFGLGGLATGVVLLVGAHLGMTGQIATWLVFSVLFTFAWFKWIKPLSTNRTSADSAEEQLVGQTATVIDVAPDGLSGKISFILPILGNDVWRFSSQTSLRAGEPVTVTGIQGQILTVRGASAQQQENAAS